MPPRAGLRATDSTAGSRTEMAALSLAKAASSSASFSRRVARFCSAAAMVLPDCIERPMPRAAVVTLPRLAAETAFLPRKAPRRPEPTEMADWIFVWMARSRRCRRVSSARAMRVCKASRRGVNFLRRAEVALSRASRQARAILPRNSAADSPGRDTAPGSVHRRTSTVRERASHARNPFSHLG